MSGKPKQIFFVLGSFRGGGTERTASRLGLSLIKRNFDVVFYILNPVFDYNDPSLLKRTVVLSNSNIKNRFIRLFLAYVKLFYQVWRHRPYRLISFSLGINLFVFFVAFPRTLFRVESNFFIYRKKKYRRYLQKIFSSFPHILHVIVPSKGLADKCQEYFFTKSKIIQIDNPIDIGEINQLKNKSVNHQSLLESKPYIVSAGRLNRSKGFEQLIRVFKKSELFTTHNLLILGKGVYHDHLVHVIKELKVENQVHLVGHVENPYPYFAKATAFVLNSAHESFANVLIESLACGTPVLSNDCDFGPRHIITHGFNGYLYNQHNENEFINLLNRFNDPATIVEIKQNALTSVQRFSIERITEQWLKFVLHDN